MQQEALEACIRRANSADRRETAAGEHETATPVHVRSQSLEILYASKVVSRCTAVSSCNSSVPRGRVGTIRQDVPSYLRQFGMEKAARVVGEE